MDAPITWIESTSWELDFFGLPNRIPWPSDLDPKTANEEPLDTGELVRGIELLGAEAGNPWTSFRLASVNFDDLAEALEDGEFPRAGELLEEVERVHPGTSFVEFHRAIVARHDGRFEEAIRHYEAAAQKTPKIGVIWLHLGMLLGQEGHRDKAIAALNTAARSNPEDTTALEALAGLRAAVKLLRDPKDPKSAVYVDLPTFRKMATGQLEQLAGNHKGLMEFGDFQLRNNLEQELGMMAFQRAAALQPDDPTTLAALSSAYRVVGRHEDAKTVATRLTELVPDEPQAWFNLAQICNAGGDKDAERNALEKMLGVDKNAQPALAILHGLNEGQTAEKAQKLADHGAKNQSYMAYLLASSVARDQGDLKSAVKWAEKAREIAPEHEEVLLHLAAILGEAKERLRLVEAIEPAVLEGKFSNRLAWNYAHALKQCGRTQEAAQTLINAASAEGAPDDFKQAASTTIDFWTGRLAESGKPLALSKSNTIARPVVIALDGEDGAIVLQAGQQVPCEGNFPWRVRITAPGETRISLQQGQSGSIQDPQSLGSFVVKVPPVTGAAHTIQCLIGVNPNGHLLFKAMQNNRELPVSWAGPVEV